MAIKTIFKSGPAPTFRTILLIIIAVVLMVLDHRSSGFHWFRNQLSITAFPIQYVVQSPVKLVNWLDDSVMSKRQLLKQNEQLKMQALLLKSRLQKLLELERVNAQLRQLLKSTPKITGHVVVAQLLAVDLNPNLQQVVVDKGSRAKVYQGQPVLDAFGVIGQVVAVGPLTSRVMLITDSRSAVPVQDSRNGVRAIAVGLGVPDKLAVINVPDTTKVNVGDEFTTSGFGLRYPVGYPVGKVVSVSHVPGSRFASIVLLPSAHIDQSQQVLLAWPSQAALKSAVKKQLQQSQQKSIKKGIKKGV